MYAASMDFNKPFLIAQPKTSTSSTTENTSATVEQPDNKDAPAGKSSGGIFSGAGSTQMIMIFVLIGVFYFLLIRPQQKKEKQRKALLNELKKGDPVVTRGGIWGVVVGLKDDEGIAVIKIAENTKIEVSKNAIEVVKPEKGDKDAIK